MRGPPNERRRPWQDGGVSERDNEAGQLQTENSHNHPPVSRRALEIIPPSRRVWVGQRYVAISPALHARIRRMAREAQP
jgi:hypothetical protein